MKKIFVFILAMATLTTLQAQQKKITGRQKDNVIAEKIRLSEEQRQKAKSLNEDFRKKMSELRKKDDITVKEWRNQMMDLNKKHRESMKDLLTKEQKEQIEKNKIERRKIAEINSKARMEKMKIRLDVNEQQAEKLKQQRSEMIGKMKAIKENKVWDDQKKREEIRTLMEKRKENVRSILTEEQVKKIKEMKEIRKPMHKKRRVLS